VPALGAKYRRCTAIGLLYNLAALKVMLFDSFIGLENARGWPK